MLRIAFGLVLVVAVLLGFVLWSRTRRWHMAIEIPRTLDPASLRRCFAALTSGRLIEGNAVRVEQDEHFFTAFFEDVARATHHVHLESFLWMDGEISNQMVESLTAAARRGVEMRVLVDQRGSQMTSPAVWTKLREGGVDLRVYHRARLLELGWYNNRDHRKIVVVDGRIGYTFGHGIADQWNGEPGKPHIPVWRDTAARFEGPVVAEFQTAFLENWVKVTRRALIGDAYFPPLAPAGTIPIHVAWAAPPETRSAVERLYYLGIAAARRELILQNPYFIPDRYAVRLCADAVQRGVRVRLMLPDSGSSDFPIVQHASHYYHGPLLRAGATIHEYSRAGIHQKVMVVDREWCTIGSTNFDPRSFAINDEISVAIYDTAIAEELARAFEEDLGGAQELTLAKWNARPWRHRMRDRASVLMKGQL